MSVQKFLGPILNIQEEQPTCGDLVSCSTQCWWEGKKITFNLKNYPISIINQIFEQKMKKMWPQNSVKTFAALPT